MKPKIIEEACIGCGLCATICPKVFAINQNDCAEVFGTVSPDLEQDVENAVSSCPVAAIECDLADQ